MSANIRAKFDLTVIGGGIVGLATAREALLRHPRLKICVLEKENDLATHQSRRNSGVVHCGIYYRKGSLKSRFCIKGAERMKEYCLKKSLPFDKCGKLIVATKQDQIETLHKLYKNARANMIPDIELITSDRVESIQPGCTKAIEAIWSPNTAIVDWQKVASSFAQDFQSMGGEVITNFTAQRFIPREKEEGVNSIVDAKTGDLIESKSVVTCAGVYSDYFARATGNDEHPKVVPFKGNYFELSDRLANSIKTNIYPVPNPKLPFLGVHVTPRVDGSVIIGPTSLLTFGYERYDTSIPPRLIELYHILYRSGLIKMLSKKEYFDAGILELRKYFFKRFVAQEVEELLPGVQTNDLVDTGFCGIRAQALTKDGELVDDFLFETGFKSQFNKILHLRNCPSPAATSSMTIAERVVNILEERFI